MKTFRGLGVRLDRWIGYAEDWSMATLLAVAACLGLLQIILRYVFSTGFDWVEAYLIMFVVYAALIGASVAVRRQVHVRLDVLVNQFPEKIRWGVQISTNLLCLFYTAAFWLFGLQFVLQVIHFNNMNILSDLPEWIHYLCVPIGLGLMSLRYIQEIVKIIADAPFRTGQKEGLGR